MKTCRLFFLPEEAAPPSSSSSSSSSWTRLNMDCTVLSSIVVSLKGSFNRKWVSADLTIVSVLTEEEGGESNVAWQFGWLVHVYVRTRHMYHPTSLSTIFRLGSSSPRRWLWDLPAWPTFSKRRWRPAPWGRSQSCHTTQTSTRRETQTLWTRTINVFHMDGERCLNLENTSETLCNGWI